MTGAGGAHGAAWSGYVDPCPPDACLANCRTDNLFKQLDERELTEEEQNIIQQRVRLLKPLARHAPARPLTPLAAADREPATLVCRV